MLRQLTQTRKAAQHLIWQLLLARKGGGLAEYGIILALVLIAVLVALQKLGVDISGIFSNVSAAL
ncbi:MAG TPA: pilus assembly protein [Anaerolineales bacterium]|nr:pilus assembly protein [Anaerolineales bacterium]